MRLLHVNFHKGCETTIEYVLNKLGHTVECWRFDDGETVGNDIYKINHTRAQKCWDKYKDFFNTFDGIITSDTCPTCRPFLQNGWTKLLIIWVCNRFDFMMEFNDYLGEGDKHYYDLIRSIPNRKNVYIAANTRIENLYSKQLRNVDISDRIIKPIGKILAYEDLYKTYPVGQREREDIFYVPLYENETKFIDLSQKLEGMGIKTNGRNMFSDIPDLLKYKGIICLPYAWSTIMFFEVMQLGMIYFIPSSRFLIEMARSQDFLSQKYWFQIPFVPDESILKYAEWYCEEHKDLVVYFDSWEELAIKVRTTNYEEQTKKILEYAKEHTNTTIGLWKTMIDDYLDMSRT